MRQIFSIFLILPLLASQGVFAQTKFPVDEVKIGQSSSNSDKGIVFDTNDGTLNQKLLVEKVSKRLKWTGNNLQIGDGNAASDKELIIAGALKSLKFNGTSGQFEFNSDLKLDGKLKADILQAVNTEILIDSPVRAKLGMKVGTGVHELKVGTSGKLEFTNDGTIFKKMGSGSGSGDGGISLIENSSFEDGNTGWVTSGGTLSILNFTNGTEEDTKYAQFVASSSGQFFETTAKVVPTFLKGQCVAYSKVQTSETSTWKIQVVSDAGVLIKEENIGALEWESSPYVAFPCPASALQMKLRFIANGSGTINVDKTYLGSENRKVTIYDDTPVGTVIASLLTEAQFQAQRGKNWVLADGRNVAGTKFAELFGSSTLPDLRGRFLRGKNNGQSTSLGNADGEIGLGVYQADDNKAHTHGAIFNTGTNSVGGAGNEATARSLNGSALGGLTVTNFIQSSGGEARPKSVTVNYFIKIEGMAITVLQDVGYAMRAGQIVSGAFAACPANTLEANGASVLRNDFPQLFAAIGTAHGTADSNSFNLPDYRGRFLRGHANGSENDPDRATRTAMASGGVIGDAVGSVQGDGYGSHTHTGSTTVRYASATGSNYTTYTGNSGYVNINQAVTVDASGGSETRPKNASVKFCIQTVNTQITGTFKQIDDALGLRDITALSSYTASTSEGTIVTSSSTVTNLSLPLSSTVHGKIYRLSNNGTALMVVTLSGAEQINSRTSFRVWPKESVTVQSTGTGYVFLHGGETRTVSFFMGSNGVVSNESLDFINGNCSRYGTGNAGYQCNIHSNYLLGGYNCSHSTAGTQIATATVLNSSLSVITGETIAASAYTANSIWFVCHGQRH
jgi:microcystin-dependent protein